MVNWITIIIIAILLIGADKTITYMNIKAVQKNFPNAPATSIEKNPVAKWCFDNLGLIGGSILMSLISFLTFFFAMWMFSFAAAYWAPDNKWGVSLYVMVMVYGFVLLNNFYFWLRYNKLL